MLNDANVKYIFTLFYDKSCLAISTLNNISYVTFKTLFITVNLLQGMFKQNENKIIVLKPEVIGMRYLWKIPFLCTDREIIEQAINFIVSLYSNLGNSLETSINEFIRAFFYSSLNKAEEAVNKKEGTMLAIKLIKTYLNGSEGERYVKLDKAIYKAEPLVTIKLEVKQCNTKNTIHNINICKTLTVFHLKNAISTALKAPLSQLKVKHKASNTVLVEKTHDKLIIGDILGTTEFPFFVEVIKPKKNNQFNLPTILSNNKDIHERLLRLMKQDEDFAEEVWKLMKGFPENLSDYKIPTDEDLAGGKIVGIWDKLMTPNGDLDILLWNIHIMKRLVSEKQFSETPTENYMQTCLKRGVFIYLTEKYKQLTLTLKKKSYTSARLVKYILKILYSAISPYCVYINLEQILVV